jgi:hypothetical protein
MHKKLFLLLFILMVGCKSPAVVTETEIEETEIVKPPVFYIGFGVVVGIITGFFIIR